MFNWMKKRKKKIKIVTSEGAYYFKDGDILMLNGFFSEENRIVMKKIIKEKIGDDVIIMFMPEGFRVEGVINRD